MLKIGRRLAMLSMMAMTMVMAGCGDDDDDGGTTPTNITGTYTMRSLNSDNTAPFTVFEVGTSRYEIVRASVTINANNTYTDETVFRETTDGTVGPEDPVEGGGTWTRSGNTITFTDSEPDSEPFTATIQADGSLLATESLEGFTFTARFAK